MRLTRSVCFLASYMLSKLQQFIFASMLLINKYISEIIFSYLGLYRKFKVRMKTVERNKEYIRKYDESYKIHTTCEAFNSLINLFFM